MRTIRVLTVLCVAALLLATLLGPATAERLAGSPTGGPAVSAHLDGQQEVDPVFGQPGAGDPVATGFAVSTISPGQGLACYELTHDLVPEPFAFHIHVGEAGENGPIVVDFFTDPTGVVPPEGCVDVDRDVAREILDNPEGYYFNAHNAPFPNGAIRGQLSRGSG
jgi:hypothetical protein